MDGVPVLGEVHGDGGDGPHGPLERLSGPVVGAGARVEDEDGAPPRRAVLLAHHELAPVGGGGPVHAPQVVTVPVAADAHVVLAVEGDHVGHLALAAEPPAVDAVRSERLDAGQDDELALAGERDARRRHAERVAPLEAERAELVRAAER